MVYFLWHTYILSFVWATFIPKKYLSCHKSFTSNSLAKSSFKCLICSSSSLVITISSTYTMNKVTFLSDECLTKIVWFDWPCMNPSFSTTRVSLSNHDQWDCLRPYKDFRSLHTLFKVLDDSSPGENLHLYFLFQLTI